MSCFNSFIPKVRCHSFRRLTHSKSNSKLTKNPFNNAVLSFAPEVAQAFVIYRYGASVFLHGEPCLAMLLFGRNADLFRCSYGLLLYISYPHKIKMSRWVRCSYGKRAGFVDAKIRCFSVTSKF